MSRTRRFGPVSSASLSRPALRPDLRRAVTVAAAVSAVAFVVIGVVVGGTSSASPLDDRLDAVVHGVSESWSAALVMDAGGEPVGAITLICAIAGACLITGRWRLAVLTVAAQGLVGLTTGLLKPVFDRTIHGSFLSYPSGHTAGAVAFAAVVALLAVDLLRARRWPALALISVVTFAVGLVAAWAQTLLVAHYATDTIGGLAMAIVLVTGTALVIDTAADRLMAR